MKTNTIITGLVSKCRNNRPTETVVVFTIPSKYERSNVYKKKKEKIFDICIILP